MTLDRHREGNAHGDLECRAGEMRELVNRRLTELIPSEKVEPQQLHKAMRYSSLGLGKRIRPVVTVLVGDSCDF